jgi:hypothetical protein
LRDGYATGSGFIIGNRYVVTNHHVIADADEVGVLAKNLKLSVSRIVIDSTDKDLAVLEVESDTGRPAVTLALNSGVQKTETVLAAGFPAAADDQGDNVNNLLEVKFSQGIISGFVTGQNGEALYQISAPLNPGNSGGPLFDECGRVIGINVEKSLVQAVVVGQDGSTSTERVPLGEGIAWSIQSDELVNLLRGSDIQVQVASNVCTPGAASTSGAGLGQSAFVYSARPACFWSHCIWRCRYRGSVTDFVLCSRSARPLYFTSDAVSCASTAAVRGFAEKAARALGNFPQHELSADTCSHHHGPQSAAEPNRLQGERSGHLQAALYCSPGSECQRRVARRL